MSIKAVLSTTVLPLDGMYEVKTIPIKDMPSLKGVPHYVGHPDTKTIVESFGAVQAPTKLFEGLQPGETAVCFPIQQGKSSRAVNGFTVHQEVSLEDLSVRIITRIDGVECIFCGKERTRLGWHCPHCGAC